MDEKETVLGTKVVPERLQKGKFHLLVRDLRLHDLENFFQVFPSVTD